MRRTTICLLVVMLVACASVAQDKWYPSRWGAEDQRGAANRITPAKVLEAKNLIVRGQTYQLGHVYEAGMPLFGTRHYSLRIPKVFGPNGTNQMYYHDEIISGELGQIGTQFDGLGHAGIGDLFYNGNKGSEFAKAEGLTKLGIENVGALVTRGVLIDVAAYKGQARRLKSEHGLSLIIIDYIQLMSGRGRFENRTLELASISRSLKGLAKELSVPIVVLSQLSRAPESRSDHRPQLSDLRESGALEQDADLVVLIYRDDAYNRDPNNPDAGTAELIVAKQRNGPTGIVRLAFLREQTRFANLAGGQ